MTKINNLRVRSITRLVSPHDLKTDLPLTPTARKAVLDGRAAVENILERHDPRLLVIAGPCSIHDPVGALDYARRLVALREELAPKAEVLMRVYFEKPRTTVGWKGLIHDPRLDGSRDMETGIRRARALLLEIVNLGLPAGTEFLDPLVPQYISDLVAWAAIGARTTESQTHRELASGLSMPVGFKNGTDGELQTALDAMKSARAPHSFLGIDQDGFTSVVHSTGNPLGHLVVRGGRARTNYDPASVADAAARLTKAGMPAAVMVDCSHANSGKEHTRQEIVWDSVLKQRRDDPGSPIIGVMLESNLEAGQQDVPANLADLKYGVSITDACIGWTQTEALLRSLV
ncbi:phospho-2-dehydro-3-deoxyheptonate aldolase [Verrucomicrobia bacterium SCGC AG-212-E04]|nr:phospho-2-dehydro-3-deoxyheptonate aldolase [Verrucomicrobia bacterium SCGC AG-212-E04]